VLLSTLTLTMFSCVSTKKFKSEVAKYDSLNQRYQQLADDLRACEDQKLQNAKKLEELQTQNDYLKKNNTAVLNNLQDLSVVTSAQAESIRKSLENLGLKDAYIYDLQKANAKKDSLNMALAMNLKSSLKDVNDKDINIKVDKSAVFIDISDKMLFKSGSYEVSDNAGDVLSKVADILKAHGDVEFSVEGHTDNAKIKTSCIKDNWDLSVLRATAIARVLQTKYGIDPKRIIASGRGEYINVTTNDTKEGMAANRRIRIVIQPELDQFFKLLETK
ncbi:MAG: OmpA family protein, partial [Chitinophagales bacterium]|nr:OmpA family protein [Chitinophagales bacterium]